MDMEQSSYRQIMKATSIFGGVQVFQIIIGIIRSKFVAVLLGPAGMGIVGLLSATLGMIGALTNFGIGTSAVKDISAAHTTGDHVRIATVVTVFRWLVWFTGILGAIITLVFSNFLSQATFGNEEYAWAFMLLSVTLLLNQLSLGQSALLQGMRQIRSMAQAGIIGSILGLMTTVPLYYYFGVKGIVPGIMITSIVSLIIARYFARKLNINLVFVSKEQIKSLGTGMLKMGFMINLSGLIVLGCSYIVSIFISKTGGVEQVGLYNAGFALVNSYVGMVFTAMSTDYYPRLAAVAENNIESNKVINQQAEIAILILGPIIIGFLMFINWIVVILYSTKFIPINDMILYAMLGVFFKAASWSVGFILLARGDSKTYFWSELIANFYILILNLLGYRFFGLEGLGISFLFGYIIFLIQIFLIAKIKFNFTFTPVFYKIFSLQLIIAILCLFTVKLLSNPYNYLIGSIFLMISCYNAYKELDKRLDLNSYLISIKSRFK